MKESIRHTEENMEQRILECAEKLFLEKGFALTSTTEIAREAGCNQALVHYYFRKKELLFQRIFESKVNIFVSSFMKIDESGKDFFERFRKRMELHFDMIWENKQLPALIINELYTNPSQMAYVKSIVEKMDKSVFLKFQKELEEEISAGRIKNMDMVDIILNVISLNFTTFITLPMLKQAGLLNDYNEKEFLEHRKEIIIDTLVSSIKK